MAKFRVRLARVIMEEAIVIVEAEDQDSINVYQCFQEYQGKFETDTDWTPEFSSSSEVEGDADPDGITDLVVTRKGITYHPKSKDNDVIWIITND